MGALRTWTKDSSSFERESNRNRERLEQREQHGKTFRRSNRVRRIRRHIQIIPRLQRMRRAVEREFALSRQHLDGRVLRGRMFSQFLSLGETKKHHAQARRAKQGAAHDPVVGELRLGGQRDDFLFSAVD